MTAPLCFVLMPFGRKSTADGRVIDFDRIYKELFAPAIRKARLEPIRADEEKAGGLIHTPMFERLVLCEYALADLTAANANVFYELGVRHAARPFTTVLAFADGFGQLPFDLAPLRAMSYRIGPEGEPLDAAGVSASIAERLIQARERSVDSPLYKLLDGYPNVAHERADVFRDRVRMSEKHRKEIERRSKLAAEEAGQQLREYETALGPPGDVESAVLVALFLAFRDLKAYEDMIRLAEAMPEPLARTTLVREQYAFALNRVGRGDEAEAVLQELLAKNGPTSELYGLLGRIYKDRYDAAREAGAQDEADIWLDKAGETYLKGFEIDWRDEYPGVNAVTLIAIRSRTDPRLAELLPIVRYAASRRLAKGKADYWGHATLVELAVIAGDEATARRELAHALVQRPKVWMRETTLKNLRLLRDAGVAEDWLGDVEKRLQGRHA